MSAQRVSLFAFLSLGVAACCFAFFGIHSRSIWLDEAYSIFTGLRPFSDIGSVTPENDLSPPLYYFVLSLWMRMFGISEIATRSLSGVFYLLALGGVYLFATSVFRDTRVGMLGAVLYMVSPLAVRHAHSARMYSLLGLEVVVSSMFFSRIFLGDPGPSRRRDAWLYVIVNAIGTLTHQWFLFSLAAQGLAFLLFVFPSKIRTASAVYVLSLLPYVLLWLPASLKQVRSGASAWIDPPSLYADLVGTFADFFGGRGLGLAVLGAFVLIVLANRKAVRALPSETSPRVALSMLFVSLASVAIPFVISQYHPVFVTGRYTIIALPPFIVGLSSVLWTHGHRPLIVACVGVLVLGSASGLLARRLPDEAASDRKTAQYLMTHGRPGDVVIYNGLSMLAIDYYFLRNHRRQDFVGMTFPRELAAHPAWMDTRSMLPRKKEFAEEAEGLARRLAEASMPGRRLWVFHGGGDSEVTDLLKSQLEKHFRFEEAHAAPGLTYRTILVFQNGMSAP